MHSCKHPPSCFCSLFGVECCAYVRWWCHLHTHMVLTCVCGYVVLRHLRGVVRTFVFISNAVGREET